MTYYKYIQYILVSNECTKAMHFLLFFAKISYLAVQQFSFVTPTLLNLFYGEVQALTAVGLDQEKIVGSVIEKKSTVTSHTQHLY